MSTNEEIAKTLAELSKSVQNLSELPGSVKSLQDELETLKRGATHSGVNPQPTGSQYSDVDLSAGFGVEPPPPKKRKPDDDLELDDEEEDADIEPTGQLVNLSEAGAAFLETAFGSKLQNENRKLKATKNGVPDSRWIRCPKIDAVVAANVSPATKKADRAASRLQQFWLDAVIPLVLTLERADELELPAEAISAIQTSLQLMGNANHHTSVSRRNALLTQRNPRLKPLFTDADFKEASPLLFGESFGTLAKERLDAATALKKTTFTGRGATQGFQKSHSQRYQGRGGGSQSSGYRGGNKGWAPAGNKATKGQKK